MKGPLRRGLTVLCAAQILIFAAGVERGFAGGDADQVTGAAPKPCAGLFCAQTPRRDEARTSLKREESGTPGVLSALIARHAQANGVPAELVHKVVRAESNYNPHARGRGGVLGLMQIKYGTARALGYMGSPQGLLDPETNLTYGVRYLAGAYQAARGHVGRAIAFYKRGYYGHGHQFAGRKGRRQDGPEPQTADAAALTEPVSQSAEMTPVRRGKAATARVGRPMSLLPELLTVANAPKSAPPAAAGAPSGVPTASALALVQPAAQPAEPEPAPKAAHTVRHKARHAKRAAPEPARPGDAAAR